jgi:hypothetical protein
MPFMKYLVTGSEILPGLFDGLERCCQSMSWFGIMTEEERDRWVHHLEPDEVCPETGRWV